MTTDVNISLAQLIWLAGGITVLAALVSWLMKPFKKLDDHELRIKTLEDSAAEQRSTDRYITKALNAIVNHMIDGNGIDELKKVRDEFQNDVINR